MNKKRDVEQHSRPPSGDTLEGRSVIVVLATAGIVGPVIFAVVALVQSLLWPDHSLVKHPLSALAGPSTWFRT